MEITGRLTAAAKVNTTRSDKKVVHFTVAMNDNYKTKDGEHKKITTYVDCSYWLNAGIAQYLMKGMLVSLYGRIGVSAWSDKDGNARAGLTFHTNDVKFLGRGATGTERVVDGVQVATTAYPDTKDDLPF